MEQLGRFTDEDVVFLKRPWQAESEAIVRPLDTDLRVPKTITEQGHGYFLEVDIARETLEMLANRQPSKEQQVALLLHYAEFDAFPDWAYR